VRRHLLGDLHRDEVAREQDFAEEVDPMPRTGANVHVTAPLAQLGRAVRFDQGDRALAPHDRADDGILDAVVVKPALRVGDAADRRAVVGPAADVRLVERREERALVHRLDGSFADTFSHHARVLFFAHKILPSIVHPCAS
jgi:hypothetical protein